MTLRELNPKVYYFNGKPAGFYFLCPHCKECLLSVKTVIISVRDQMYCFMEIFGPGHQNIVPCKTDMCWQITGNSWDNLSVYPSLDASKSGHWHGYISNGKIT